MIPDGAIVWDPIPTALDGLQEPHLRVGSKHSRGLRFVITGRDDAVFGVFVPGVVSAMTTDELTYSLAKADKSATYEGRVYVKEARNSVARDKLQGIDAENRRLRHFLFIGGFDCLEVIAAGEPEITKFDNIESAWLWAGIREIAA